MDRELNRLINEVSRTGYEVGALEQTYVGFDNKTTAAARSAKDALMDYINEHYTSNGN